MGLLNGLGNDVALGHAEVGALVAWVRRAGHHPQAFARGFFPRLFLVAARGEKSADLRLRRALAGPKLHATVRDDVERCNPLRDARGMILAWRHLDDAVAQPNVFGA